MKILDVHSHCIPSAVAQNTTFFKQFWSDDGTQLKTMDAHGIEKSVLLYPTSDAHVNMGSWAKVCRVYNEELAKVVGRHPTRFVGAGILPADDAQALSEELARVADSNFKFLSMASSYDGVFLSDERFHPVFELAQKKGLIVHVHPQIMNPIGEDRVRDPLLTPVLEYVFDVSACIGKMMMEGTFQKFPDVKFIFAHYGGVIPFVKERFDNTYQMLRKRNYVKDLGKNPSEYFKNLYIDTSGSRSPGALACALEVVDAGHILWGSDYPANQNLPDAIKVVADSPLKREDQERIFGGTLAGLLGR